MLPAGKRFRLAKCETVGVPLDDPHEKHVVLIPSNSIIEVIASVGDDDRTVTLKCDGSKYQMFLVDVIDRGEPLI